jgi:hypothetical protein
LLPPPHTLNDWRQTPRVLAAKAAAARARER